MNGLTGGLMKNFFLGLVFLLPVAATGSALADVITFDDLPNPGIGSPLPNGYHGLNYTNFSYLNSLIVPGSGYANGTVSPSYVAFNNFASPASLTSAGGTAFTLDSFYLAAAWNDGLNVTVTASRLGVVMDTATFIVSSTGPTLETLNWTDIDTVQFSSSGGTPPPYLPQPSTQFVLDNLTIEDGTTSSPVPEAATLLLLGTGLAGMLGLPNRRKLWAHTLSLKEER